MAFNWSGNIDFDKAKEFVDQHQNNQSGPNQNQDDEDRRREPNENLRNALREGLRNTRENNKAAKQEEMRRQREAARNALNEEQPYAGPSADEMNKRPETTNAAPETKAPETPKVITMDATPVKEKDAEYGPRYQEVEKPAETVTYTPPSTTADATKNAADIAARTKEALTGEVQDGWPQWMKDLAAANAEDKAKQDSYRRADATAKYLAEHPEYRGIYTGETTAGADKWLTESGNANAAREDTARRLADQARRAADAVNSGMRRPGYDYDPGAAMAGSRYAEPPASTTPATPSNPYTQPGTPVTPNRAEESGPNIPQVPNSNVRGEPTPEDLARQYGIPVTVLDDPQFQEVYANLKAQRRTNASAMSDAYARYADRQSAAERKQVNDRVNQIESGMDSVTSEQHQEIVNQVRQEIADVNAYAASKRNGYEYNPPRTSTSGYAPTSIYVPETPGAATPPTTGGSNERTGVNEALATVMNNNARPDIDINAYGASKRDGYDYKPGKNRPRVGIHTDEGIAMPEGTKGGTTGGTTTGGTTTGSNGAVPKGSKTYDPSYGQGGKVVKAPYKYKGYTADELLAMGNHVRTDFTYNNGKPAFEGYYQAPDGAYYPVDQVKAQYYKQNGGSYAGWDEGMRGYYNTYGTFYGYRPDYKTAGKGSSGGGNRRSGGGGSYINGFGGTVKKSSKSNTSSSYSYGGGNNYGSGYTPNNGLYWNGNTSWSI